MEKRMLTPAEICDYTISTGTTKANSRILQMLILGILAGAFIGFGAFASTVASHSIENYGISKLVAGAVFPVGLILVVIYGAELFTGNTMIALAVFDRKVSIKNMLKNWAIVYVGNFIGSFILALLIFLSGALEVNAGKLGATVIKVASYKGGLSFQTAIASGILCNVLVCLAVLSAYASKDIIGKIFAAWFPIMAFITSGFEHSIANMYYFSVGILSMSNGGFVKGAGLSPEKLTNVNWYNAFFSNIIPVTIGNIIGGAIFVGLSYWVVHRYVPSIGLNKPEPVNSGDKLGPVGE